MTARADPRAWQELAWLQRAHCLAAMEVVTDRRAGLDAAERARDEAAAALAAGEQDWDVHWTAAYASPQIGRALAGRVVRLAVAQDDAAGRAGAAAAALDAALVTYRRDQARQSVIDTALSAARRQAARHRDERQLDALADRRCWTAVRG